ncbi:MAG: helix-turn-helix domain-containing protein [Salibacteraceae bacterium]
MFSSTHLPPDVLQGLASRWKSLRKAHKISQSEMADRSGASLGSIKRFERSGHINLISLLKLAHVLDRLDDFNSLFVADPNLDLETLFSDRTRRK